jgi:hypothetical protein
LRNDAFEAWSFGRESFGDGCADTFGCAGDDGDFASKFV